MGLFKSPWRSKVAAVAAFQQKKNPLNAALTVLAHRESLSSALAAPPPLAL